MTQDVDFDGNALITFDEAAQRFDRWLAAHNRKVAAKAWDEGHDAGQVNEHEHRPNRKMSNPYRADRIERGGDDV